MRVLVLGGDGFIGWPLCMRLAMKGYDVTAVDNLSRRRIDQALNVGSLTPIEGFATRTQKFREITGRNIQFLTMNIAENYEALAYLIPHHDVVIHLAEQKSAPYSMRSSQHKRFTVDHNMNATANLLTAAVEVNPNIHIIHIGTMGVYGYGGKHVTPEGYVTVSFPGGAQEEIVHPYNPGSVYHMTKCMDHVMFQFFAKNDNLRITDLHQGVVWGSQTEETCLDEVLVNRFDYDGDFGTVLNRFIVQGACDIPLTVYGTGGQSRAFIHLQDSIKCLELVIENPPSRGDRPIVMNQIAEVQSVEGLATRVAKLSGAVVRYIDNPRKEAAENELLVSNTKLQDLGFTAAKLSDGLLKKELALAVRYRANCRQDKILPQVRWSNENIDNRG